MDAFLYFDYDQERQQPRAATEIGILLYFYSEPSMTSRKPTQCRFGFTLVELLVVIAIIAMLVTLLLPAVQAAREAARRTQCLNNMRNMVLGWLNHESSLGFMPSSGWGWRWQGDPDRGFGKSQPGGWAYDILPFMEQADIRNLGKGLPDAQKGKQMLVAVTTPIPIFNCPTRREARTYPKSKGGALADNLTECMEGKCAVARSDYQANSGNVAVGETRGPSGNRSTEYSDQPYHGGRATGVTHHLSEFRIGQIEDGTSKTMAVGEKYLNADRYTDGLDPADDQNILQGVDRDVNGYTACYIPSSNRVVTDYVPRRDKHGIGLNWTFGSAHESIMNTVFCDGSGRSIQYGIEPAVFWAMGGRSDGAVAQLVDSAR